MKTDRELMQQALEALLTCTWSRQTEDAITSLRERLAQPAQEPVSEAYALADKVRTELDKQSCPGVYMNIAWEAVVKNHRDLICTAPQPQPAQEPFAHGKPDGGWKNAKTPHNFGKPMGYALVTNADSSVPFMLDGGAHTFRSDAEKVLALPEYAGTHHIVELVSKASPLPEQQPAQQTEHEPVAWNDENVIAYCVKRGIQAAQEYTTTQPKPAAQPAQQPDLSRLMPATQAAIRSWLADGTFVERAIGVMHEQEAEIMRMQGRELKLQFALQAEKPAQQPLKSLTDLQIDAVPNTLDLPAPRAIPKAAIHEFCHNNDLIWTAHGIKEAATNPQRPAASPDAQA